MAITLSTFGLYETGTTPVQERGVVVVSTSGGAEAVTLPASASVGYHFWLVRSGANAVTLVAPAGETVTGADALGTDGAKVHLVHTSATTWNSYEDATYS